MRLPIKLPAARTFDVVGFGLNAVDHLIVVPEYPGFDTKVRLVNHQLSAGGQTATAMVSLRRLGIGTAYAGRFGDDEPGKFGIESLKSEGVDVRFAEIISGATNQIAFIIVDQRNGERTIIWDRDESLAYSAEEAPLEFASLGRVLHIDAHDPSACARMAAKAREVGAVVSADIDNIYEGLTELLPLIDILISSKDFPHRLTGIGDEKAALVEMKARYGCAVVGITKGAEGALVYCDGEFFDSPAFSVPGRCEDTTGAGDAFHAGFLYGVLTGEEVETCLKFANAVAALKCRKMGARTGLPTKKELTEFLQLI
jgi:sugar/nucleoside kinase (ribokinase family)